MASSVVNVPPTAALLTDARAFEAPMPAAGHDESVPRGFLALADVAALGLALALAVAAAPWVQWLLLPTGPLGLTLPSWLSPPSMPSFEAFPSFGSVAWMLLVVAPLAVVMMEALGGYRQLVHQSRTRLVYSTVAAPLLALSVLTFISFALKLPDSSRILVFTFGGSAIVTLLAYRSALWWYKRTRLNAGIYARNAVVVSHAGAAATIAEHFERNVPGNRLRLVGWLPTDPQTPAGPAPALAQLGDVASLGHLLIHRPIDVVIVVQPFGDCSWLRQVVSACDYFRVRLHVVPEALLVDSLRDLQPILSSKLLQLPEIVLVPPHFESDALFVKRLLDIVVSAALLLLLAPLFAAIAAAIKLKTPQLPVFYAWRVVGLKGRQFTGYKFTTMVADADERKQDLMPLNEMTGPVFKIKDDPRVTPLGRFLRKYSLNELPQLWSVLKGDMSLVGPRPAGPHELIRYELWHKRKLSVQPGITCLWQVSGRNRISNFDDWVRMDLEYIANWSLWLDLKILFRTGLAVVKGTGS